MKLRLGMPWKRRRGNRDNELLNQQMIQSASGFASLASSFPERDPSGETYDDPLIVE